MQYTEIMVRYGELSTKGKNRRNFIDSLGRNVRKALHDFPELKVHANRDRMHIMLNGEDADKVMGRLKLVLEFKTFHQVFASMPTWMPSMKRRLRWSKPSLNRG